MVTNPILPLIIIAGPTASGKTSLAIDIAEACGGEIICADSRTIYKGMDIGTAKPTDLERLRVPHWGLDLVNPGEYFSAADFKTYAMNKIDEIRNRGNVPFLVGGTGLYIDSVLFDFQFGGVVNEKLRDDLNKLSILELQEYCKKHNIELPENHNNKRYLIRSIERNGNALLRRDKPIENAYIVGIATNKNILHDRIELRANQLFDDNVVKEAKLLGKKFGWDSEAMKGNIYPLIKLYDTGEMTIDEIKSKFITLDWRLAKRQLTWLKRNPFIKWGSIEELRVYLFDLLAKC